ncbi:MAG: hypothetical protein V7L26_04590 [Nostoc sp.]|uniref:hypothetical protein n=1 Tax=Nostoc sp. TaxID=1180 RepID=UPI002FF30937
MKRTLIYTAVCSVATAYLVCAGYASAKNDNNQVANIDNSGQFPPTSQLVKQTFKLHIPKNGNALSELIIDVPSLLAVSNDIDISDDQGQNIRINISIKGRRIIIDFPKPVTSSTTKLQINLNKVKQPRIASTSTYHLSIKVVGSDVEIPLGEASFPTFE